MSTATVEDAKGVVATSVGVVSGVGAAAEGNTGEAEVEGATLNATVLPGVKPLGREMPYCEAHVFGSSPCHHDEMSARTSIDAVELL